MFQAILFDFDGTLVDFVAADIRSLRWLYAHTGAAVAFEDFLETAVAEIMKFHDLVAQNEIDPLQMHPFRLRNSFARHQITWHDDYLALYRGKLLELCVPFAGVEELLTAVKRKTKTGLITNAYDAAEQKERIRSSGLDSYFDTIIIAGEIGIYKPDPAIFLHALARVDAQPDKSLYVGDSLTHDVIGAKSAGMKTVLLSQKPKKGGDIADYEVSGIGELQRLLELEVWA